jgi:transcriptional regulator GlxA family with amidase domain
MDHREPVRILIEVAHEIGIERARAILQSEREKIYEIAEAEGYQIVPESPSPFRQPKEKHLRLVGNRRS